MCRRHAERKSKNTPLVESSYAVALSAPLINAHAAPHSVQGNSENGTMFQSAPKPLVEQTPPRTDDVAFVKDRISGSTAKRIVDGALEQANSAEERRPFNPVHVGAFGHSEGFVSCCTLLRRHC